MNYGKSLNTRKTKRHNRIYGLIYLCMCVCSDLNGWSASRRASSRVRFLMDRPGSRSKQILLTSKSDSSVSSRLVSLSHGPWCKKMSWQVFYSVQKANAANNWTRDKMWTDEVCWPMRRELCHTGLDMKRVNEDVSVLVAWPKTNKKRKKTCMITLIMTSMTLWLRGDVFE